MIVLSNVSTIRHIYEDVTMWLWVSFKYPLISEPI